MFHNIKHAAASIGSHYNNMKRWISDNKSWLFSGLAVYFLGLLSGAVRDSIPFLNQTVGLKVWLFASILIIPPMIMAAIMQHRAKTHKIEMARVKEGHTENNSELEDLILRDPLTGLYNLRKLVEIYAHEFPKLEKTAHGISGLLVDIDNFNSFQEPPNTFRQGSNLLKQVASVLLRRVARPTDFLVKYGGDEFLIIVADTPPQGTVKFAELIQKWLSEEHFYTGNRMERITLRASIGITKFNPNSDTPELFEDRLYLALKAAKAEPGKNAIAVR